MNSRTTEALWCEMRTSIDNEWLICAHSRRPSDRPSNTRLSVWGLAPLHHVRDFEGLYDGGGRRIAVAPGGQLFATGAFAEGVAVYDYRGKELWREERGHLQVLEFWDHARLGIGWDGFQYELRAALTGQVLMELPGIRRAFVSPRRQHYLVEDALNEEMQTVRIDGVIERSLLALEGYAANVEYHDREELAYIAESGGPLRCVDLDTARVAWRMDFEGKNRSWLAYQENSLFAFTFDPSESMGSVIIMDSATGKPLRHITEITRLREEVVLKGPLRLLDASGNIYSVAAAYCSLVAKIRMCSEGRYEVMTR